MCSSDLGGDAQRGDLPVQSVQHRLELGAQDGGVALHQLQGVGLVRYLKDKASTLVIVAPNS